jgi:predicted Zn-dependent peptidase
MLSLKDFNVTKKKFKTSNGINVVLFKSPNMPVCYEISFLAGSRYDLDGKDGTAHFLEHMLLGGSKNFPTKDLLAMEIENLGGSIGASANADTIDINVALGDPNDLEKSLFVISDMLNNSLFEEKTLENERSAILREIGMAKSSQNSMFRFIIPQMIYADNPLSRLTLGTTETVNNLSKNDLIEFKNTHFNGENTSITISGDLNEENLKLLIEKYFTLPKGERKNFEEYISTSRNKFADFVFYENENTSVRLIFKTVNMLSKDKMPLRIISSILGGGRASVLHKKLRYEKGFAYNLGTGASSLIDRGDFEFYITLKKENIQEALDIFTSEIKKIALEGPSEEQLQFVKNRSLKSLRLKFQTCFDWVDTHSSRNTFFPDSDWTIEDNFKEIENTTAEDVKRVAKEYFNNSNWYLAFSGPVDQEFINQIKIEF